MTSTPPQDQVVFRDVTLRDGLQLTGKLLPTERKLVLIRKLLAVGVPAIEIGSMARADLVPALADTSDLITNMTPDELKACWVWVATPRHVERAAQRGAVGFQYCLSVSDAHNRANLDRPTEASLNTLPEAVAAAESVGGVTQLCLATAFTCPFEGPVDPDRVLEIANDPRTAGTADIVLCDTLGQAQPKDVEHLIRRVRHESPERRIVFHGHDTWGMGVANTLTAVRAGASMVDGALGGLGGCPFAPGASGNAATEDVVFALEPNWVNPTRFADLVGISAQLLGHLGEPNRSKAAEGARSNAFAFPWVVRGVEQRV